MVHKSITCRSSRRRRGCGCRSKVSTIRRRVWVILRLKQRLREVIKKDARRGAVQHEYGRSTGPRLELVHRQRDVLRVTLTETFNTTK